MNSSGFKANMKFILDPKFSVTCFLKKVYCVYYYLFSHLRLVIIISLITLVVTTTMGSKVNYKQGSVHCL